MGIMEKKMETTIMGYIGYRIWGSYCNIPKARFYLLEGDYIPHQQYNVGNLLHQLFKIRMYYTINI